MFEPVERIRSENIKDEMSIKLRYPEIRDAEWMLKLENSPEASKYSDYDADFTLSDVKNFIDLNRTGADPSQARLVVEVDGKPAGTVDITGISRKNGHADIGVFIEDDYRREGVGTDALRKATEIAAMMGVCHIRALIAGDNKASMGLFEKCGFEKIGELPGWLNHGKEKGVIFYLSIMGQEFEDEIAKDAAHAGYDEFSLYGLDSDEDPYKSPFDDEFIDDGYGDDEFGGYESLDDYIDKI